MPTATQARSEPTEACPPPLADTAGRPPETADREERTGEDQRRERRPPSREERQLPLRTRVILGTAGGLLVVLGIAGLFLPFLQGILFLVLAAAVLSLTSRRIYGWLQRTIGGRWPHAWQRVERFRTRVRWKLRRK